MILDVSGARRWSSKFSAVCFKRSSFRKNINHNWYIDCFSLNLIINEFEYFLMVTYFKNPIASHQQESCFCIFQSYLSFGVNSVFFMSGTAVISYSPTLREASFLYSISPNARDKLRLPLLYYYMEITIDPTITNETSCFFDSSLLLWHIRFVVNAHVIILITSAEYWSWISSITNIKCVFVY